MANKARRIGRKGMIVLTAITVASLDLGLILQSSTSLSPHIILKDTTDMALLSLSWPPAELSTNGNSIDSRHQAHNQTSQAERATATLQAKENTTSTRNNNSILVVDNDKDKDCIFRHSPLYRKVYVYPSPGEAEWTANATILSPEGRQRTQQQQQQQLWPWTVWDNYTRTMGTLQYHVKGGILAQFSTELLIRTLFVHADSCLRTFNPNEADLFYVPYLPSMEFHGGSKKRNEVSPYARAIQEALDFQNYSSWERVFGLTSEYWKRRNGSDHILVFSEPLAGLSRPKGKRGSYHYIHTQKQLSPAIVISVELSTSFIEMYPACSTAKNILLPYPIVDGNSFNYFYEQQTQQALYNLALSTMSFNTSNAAATEETTSSIILNITETAVPNELSHLREMLLQLLKKESSSSSSRLLSFHAWNHTTNYARPIAIWYYAGVHGECVPLRRALRKNHRCTASYRATARGGPVPTLFHTNNNTGNTSSDDKMNDSNDTSIATNMTKKKTDDVLSYLGMRMATFCPCPGGDSASAKRMFDAVLAGCIPVILSHDFVWPLSMEISIPTNHTKQEGVQHQQLLNPDDFSIRLPSKHFSTALYDKACNRISLPTEQQNQSSFGMLETLQEYLHRIPLAEIQRLRRGVQNAARQYSYFQQSNLLPANPLQHGILPNGGAAHALVESLAARAQGRRWPACWAELELQKEANRSKPDPESFVC